MKRNFITMLLLTVTLRLLSGGAEQPRHIDAETRRCLAGRILSAELGVPVELVTAEEPPEAPTLSVPASDELLPVVPAAAETPAPIPETEESPESSGAPVPRTVTFSRDTFTNRTSLSVDADELRRQPLTQRLPADAPQILILHTHGSEAYTPSPGWEYEESDDYRCTDTAVNVVRVGDELAAELSRMGLRVIHDRELYDYPDYTASYSRAAAAIEQWLTVCPSLAVVIDVHRDALIQGDVVYKTKAEGAGESMAQVMLLSGTGENGLPHPRWQENFKLALRLQDAMTGSCATLPRPIELVRERYNQHYTTGSLILEVGSCGNTLPEALAAVRAFARCAAPVLLSLAE